MKESEFFHQIGLLVKAKLPLPEAFKAMAESYRKDAEMYLRIKNELDNGKRLSEALHDSGKYSKTSIELIQIAERNDTLDKTLKELARFSHLEKTIKTMIKELMVYPVSLIFITLFVTGALANYCIKDFKPMIHDFLGDGEPLGSITRFLWTINSWITSNYTFYNIILIVLAIFSFLMFTGKIISPSFNRVAFRICSLWTSLPYFFYSSKLCSFLSLHLNNKSEMHSILSSSSAFIGDKYLIHDLQVASESLQEGKSIDDVVEEMRNTDPLIKYTLKNDSNELANDFEELANTYYERCFFISQRLIFYWQVIMIVLVSLLIAGTVFTVMSPMIDLIKRM